MDRNEIERLLMQHLEAFRRLDPVLLAATHTPDGVFESPAHGRIVGRPAIEEVYRYWIAAFPDFVFDWSDPIIDGDRVALFWRFSGTAQGPFFGVVRPGSRVDIDGAAEYRLASGEIAHARHVFDFSGALMKAGVLKARPG